jgi:hypothetical protein
MTSQLGSGEAVNLSWNFAWYLNDDVCSLLVGSPPVSSDSIEAETNGWARRYAGGPLKAFGLIDSL